jgi:hypothetical protein
MKLLSGIKIFLDVLRSGDRFIEGLKELTEELVFLGLNLLQLLLQLLDYYLKVWRVLLWILIIIERFLQNFL